MKLELFNCCSFFPTSRVLALLLTRVCKSGYPLSGYPDLSVNFMAAKNPDILVANPDIRYPKIRISL